MPHPKLPFLTKWAPVVHAEGVFSAAECEKVLDLATPSDAGQIVGPNGDASYRDSRVTWIRPAPQNNWLFEKLGGYVQSANEVHFQMELAGFTEPLQVGEYGPGQFYDWHLDMGNERFSIRKLSFIVQLSDPANYTGGTVEAFCAKDPIQCPNSQGAMILFPSYVLHRVCGVETGLRRSLVGWIGGPPHR